jgi:hypothetical protein
MPGIRDDIGVPVTNDTGTGRDGTRVDEVWVDDLLDAIDAWVYSPTNPTVQPNDITNEVVTARGSKASVDARLDVAHNEDGTLKTTGVLASYATVTQLLGGIGGKNLVTNDDFLLWAAGDAAAPTGDVLAGTGASIARTGTGLGDTNRKIGDFAAKITRAAADTTLTRSILSGTPFTRANWIIGLYAAGGMWVKTSIANHARISIYDGIGFTYSSYHTGGGTWEFLPVTRQINASADRLELIKHVNNTPGAAYFSGRTLFLIDSNLSLPRHVPCDVIYGTFHFASTGNIAIATNVARLTPSRPGIVKDVQLHLKTAPTGQAAIIDVNTYDGASLTSMFSSNPQIAAAANDGGAQPDGTYARRCFVGWSGTSIVTGGRISLDVDQIGSGTAGADLTVEVRALQYQSPLDRYQST